MGTTLTGTTPQDTYDSLIKVTDNGPLSGTAKYLSDGLGNDSALALSTARVGIGTASPAYKLDANAGFSDGSNDYVATFHSSTGSSGDAFVGIGAYRSDGLGNGRNAYINAVAPSGGSGNLGLQISGGNVGIGTSAPAGNLHIASAVDTGIRIQAGASSLSYIDLADTASGTPAGSIAYNHISNAIVFATDTNVERARITSNGLSFNGDTAAANALDDYEEGTFTPTIVGTSTAGTATYVERIGTYTKIGNVVNFSVTMNYNSGTGTGNLRIGGLPFTSSSQFHSMSIGALSSISLTALHIATAFMPKSVQYISFEQYPTGGGGSIDVPFDAQGVILVSGSYTV